MKFRYLAAAALILTAPIAAFAQPSSAADSLVAEADGAYAALDVAKSLEQYEAAIAADSSHYEALWKASRSAVDLAEYEPDGKKKQALFEKGERLARLAVKVRPDDAEGYFSLARALGRVALNKGPRDRIKYGTEVRASALRALELNPDHPGALHVLGRWNAEVMRLSGFTRFLAKNLLGGKVLGEASWENARKNMERAVAVDPDRLVHHLGLAEIYIDLDEKELAREQLSIVLNGPQRDYNDKHYKQEAAALLEKIE
jgi:tetratricopeptide (TPR) repeat protein